MIGGQVRWGPMSTNRIYEGVDTRAHGGQGIGTVRRRDSGTAHDGCSSSRRPTGGGLRYMPSANPSQRSRANSSASDDSEMSDADARRQLRQESVEVEEATEADLIERQPTQESMKLAPSELPQNTSELSQTSCWSGRAAAPTYAAPPPTSQLADVELLMENWRPDWSNEEPSGLDSLSSSGSTTPRQGDRQVVDLVTPGLDIPGLDIPDPEPFPGRGIPQTPSTLTEQLWNLVDTNENGFRAMNSSIKEWREVFEAELKEVKEALERIKPISQDQIERAVRQAVRDEMRAARAEWKTLATETVSERQHQGATAFRQTFDIRQENINKHAPPPVQFEWTAESRKGEV
ncbi:hypothetical protein EV426DRAFT_621589, partial [Tirmania nivea]